METATTSTTIRPTKPQGILPPVGPRRAVFHDVFAAGKAAFGDGIGLTCIDQHRAFFQRIGDGTFYSVAITPEQAQALGYAA